MRENLAVCAVAGAIVVGMTASASLGGILEIQVRDKVGGETAGGNPGGMYLVGTGSRVRGTLDGGAFRNVDVGTFDLEINFGSGWSDFRTYTLYPLNAWPIGPNPHDDVGEAFKPVDLEKIDCIPNKRGAKGILPDDERAKISLFSNVPLDSVISVWDADSIYKSPRMLHDQKVDELLCEQLRLQTPPADLSMWDRLVHALEQSQTNAVRAAAFQFLVWEYVWDPRVDFTTGNIRLGDTPGAVAVRELAQLWASRIAEGVWTSRTDLQALEQPVCCGTLPLIPVPSPGSVGLGMVSVVMLSRRKRS
jgi:hypothetical protein